MKKVIIYPGRFQPMLSHHAEVYRQLQSQFPDADVYIGTSDKVELPKSPFNFKEKQLIAKAHGIDPSKVLQVARPYHKDDYKQFDEDNTIIIFAVGEKDLDRFPFGNIDPETGLDMTVKGETKPKYYQKINTLNADPRSMQERGYITLAPTVKAGDDVASASAFRDAIKNAPDTESAKQVFTKQFGNFDQKVFNLIYSKVKGTEMSEQLNILRKLAGLKEAPVQMPDFAAGERPTTPKEREAYRKWKAGEKADVKSADVAKPEMDFEPISPKDRRDAAERPAKADASNPTTATFTKIKPEDMMQKGKPIPSKQRKNSLANRFPASADINNPETKKEMFLKIAARTPYLLFSEINARLGNDENSLAVSDKLSSIVAKFGEGEKLMNLPADEKSFALKVLGNAINNMELVRSTDTEKQLDEPQGDGPEFDYDIDDETMDTLYPRISNKDDELADSVNFDDIRAEYGIQEGDWDDDFQDPPTAMCPDCEGAGEAHGEPCERCGGAGEVFEGSEEDDASVGQLMAQDGIVYSKEKEKQIIGMIPDYMKKAGFSEKDIRYYFNYVEDFIPDVLAELPRDEQGVAEDSEWEIRHDEFTTVGDRATPEHINKIVSALGIAAKKAASNRGFLNQIFGKQSNGDLAQMAHAAETLAKNIQRNSNAEPGTAERKELGQHLVYAVSLLKRMNDEQGVAEGAVCAQCGDPNCTCPPGECDCDPVEEVVKETTEITMDLWKQISARKAELMGEDDDEMEPEEAQDTAAEEFGVDPGELNDWLDSQYESVKEAVEATANDAFEAAMSELRKLAGL